jgi:hypothetical protein
VTAADFRNQRFPVRKYGRNDRLRREERRSILVA